MGVILIDNVSENHKNNRGKGIKMVTVGVFGYGYWGPNLVRNFDMLPGVRLKTVCDTDGKTLEALKAQRPEMGLTTDPDDIFNDSEIEAVVLALPAPLHFEYSKKALLCGKHVFVEKPLTISVADAREIVSLVEKTKLVLLVGHLLLYHAPVLYMKQVVDSGELGSLYYINFQRLNLGKVRSHENALWSLAPHDISILIYLMDEMPERVMATGSSFIQPGIEDMAFVHLYFSRNRIAHIHVSWLDPFRIRQTTVVGEKKVMVFDDVEHIEKVKIFDKKVERPFYASYGEALTLRFGNIFIPHIETKEPLKTECQHFVDCILNGKKPLTDVYSGLDVVRVLAAADRSLKQGGKEVRLDEIG